MKVAVCKLDDIPRLGARRYRRDDGDTIAIFRTADDRVFALRDRCPHKGGPLSQGIVFGESVSCPLHGWCIGLQSGEAAAPDVGRVERFAVEVVDGVVELDADTAACHSREVGNPISAPQCPSAPC
jgi:nitrite reductase (NADH) small subunit